MVNKIFLFVYMFYIISTLILILTILEYLPWKNQKKQAVSQKLIVIKNKLRKNINLENRSFYE